MGVANAGKESNDPEVREAYHAVLDATDAELEQATA